MNITPIETSYHGCRFRSRLEARWACFWDDLGIPWEYEPQGFMVGGRSYLPDFRLANRTWIEVKGDEDELDHDLMLAAAEQLPGTSDPRLLILGPVPTPPSFGGENWAWLGLNTARFDGEDVIMDDWWEFGEGGILRPADTSGATPVSCGDGGWLTPAFAVTSAPASVITAYRAARSARFEYGETPRWT